jgi:hypothetical protein
MTAPAGLQGDSFQPLLVNPQAACDRPAISQVRRPISISAAALGRGTAASLTGPDADAAAANRAAPGPNVGYTIRTDLYRYIAWDEGKAGEELFEELNDPGETRNLAAQPFYAKVLADMRQRLAEAKK